MPHIVDQLQEEAAVAIAAMRDAALFARRVHACAEGHELVECMRKGRCRRVGLGLAAERGG